MINGVALAGVTAREIIRNLMDGVVPADGCTFFSHGRDRWLESLRIELEDLPSEFSKTGRLRILRGRNGDGKTHLMNILRHESLTRGFAVSYIVVSVDVPLFRWDRIYTEIARNIGTPSGRRGLRSILNPRDPAPEIALDFRAKAAAVRSLGGIDTDFATAIYRFTTEQGVNMDREQDMHLLGAWLEGSAAPLRAFGIASVVNKTNGAAILRSLVRTLRYFGFPGVVIMVDEVESVLSLSKPQRRESYETLRLLVDGTNNAEHSLTVASTTPPMYTDIDKGLQTYPALWSRIRTDEFGDVINYHGTIIDLTRTPLTAKDYLGIAQSISQIYAIGWQCNDPWGTISGYSRQAAELAANPRITMAFSPPRVFVKVTIDMLNSVREYGAISPSYGNMAQVFGTADAALVEQYESQHPE